MHDGERSHAVLVEELCLREEVHLSATTKGLADKDNPLDPINRECNYLKQFLKSHPGFDRKYLQGLLDLYSFIANNEKFGYMEMVKRLISEILKNRNVLRYRKFYKC